MVSHPFGWTELTRYGPAKPWKPLRSPKDLAEAWSGPYRYGISGSLVAFFRERAGRAIFAEALAATTQEEILDKIGMTEPEFLAAWEGWVQSEL